MVISNHSYDIFQPKELWYGKGSISDLRNSKPIFENKYQYSTL